MVSMGKMDSKLSFFFFRYFFIERLSEEAFRVEPEGVGRRVLYTTEKYG